MVNMSVINDLKRQVKLQSYQIEKMEQYSRRDNVKIKGLKYEDGEDTTNLVMELAAGIGVNVAKEDISTSHRVGMTIDINKPKPIIVKFARRDKMVELLRNKRKLRRGIYVEEDLTKTRHNMNYEIRKDPQTSKTWTIGGKIYALVKENGKEVKKAFDTPDDMYKLGWSADKLEAFLNTI